MRDTDQHGPYSDTPTPALDHRLEQVQPLIPMRTCCREYLCHCGERSMFLNPARKGAAWHHCLFCRCNEHDDGTCGAGCTLHSKKERNARIDALNNKFESPAVLDAWQHRLALAGLDLEPEDEELDWIPNAQLS